MLVDKKILFFVDHLHGGGAEQILLDVANNLAKKNHVTLALLDSSNIRMYPSSSLNIYKLDINEDFMNDYIWREKPRILNSTEILKVNTIIKETNPDVIILTHGIAYFLSPYITGNILFWLHGKVLNLIPRKTTRPHIWLKRRREKKLEIERFSKILNNKNLICVNKDIVQMYARYLPQSNFHVIHNGIDLKRLTKNVDLNDNKKIWDAIYVGRLSAEKQPHHALIAFAKSGLKGRLAIVGDGNELNGLKALSKKLNITNRVDFLNWQQNVGNFIIKSKCLLLTSIEEGSPLIICEAIMLGTPVLAYNCSEGVHHQLNSNELKNGLVKNQDVKDMALKLKLISNQPYTITDDDKNRLSIESMTEKFHNLFT